MRRLLVVLNTDGLSDLLKSVIKAHSRHLKSGAVTWIPQHTDKRTKKYLEQQAQQVAAGQQGMFDEEEIPAQEEEPTPAPAAPAVVNPDVRKEDAEQARDADAAAGLPDAPSEEPENPYPGVYHWQDPQGKKWGVVSHGSKFKIHAWDANAGMTVNRGEDQYDSREDAHKRLDSVAKTYKWERGEGPANSAHKAALDGETEYKKVIGGLLEEGSRVTLTGGRHAGRHGVITSAVSYSMSPVFGGGESSHRAYYTVKTDGGIEAHVNADELEAETGEAPEAEADVRISGYGHVAPDDLPDAISRLYEKEYSNQGLYRRARLPQTKQKWLDAKNAAHDAGAQAVDALREWAKKNPEKAGELLKRYEDPAAHKSTNYRVHGRIKAALRGAAAPKEEDGAEEAAAGDAGAAEAPAKGVSRGAKATVSHNREKNGVEVKFESKPDPSILAKLKGLGFRWGGRHNPVWYARFTDAKWDAAHEIAGVAKGGGEAAAPATAPEEAEGATEGAAPAEKPDFDTMVRDAAAWRHFSYLAAPSKDAPYAEHKAHMDATTRFGLDEWLKNRFGLDDSEARSVSNAAEMRHNGTEVSDSGVRWNQFKSGGMAEPKWEDYPDVAEKWQAQAEKKQGGAEAEPDYAGLAKQHGDSMDRAYDISEELKQHEMKRPGGSAGEDEYKSWADKHGEISGRLTTENDARQKLLAGVDKDAIAPHLARETMDRHNARSAKLEQERQAKQSQAGGARGGGPDPDADWDTVRDALHSDFKGMSWNEAALAVKSTWKPGAARDKAERHAQEMARAEDNASHTGARVPEKPAAEADDSTKPPGPVKPYDPEGTTIGADAYAVLPPHERVGIGSNWSPSAVARALDITPEQLTDKLRKLGHPIKDGSGSAGAAEKPGRKADAKVEIANFPRVPDGKPSLHGSYNMGKVHEHLAKHYGQDNLTDAQALDFVRGKGGAVYGSYSPKDEPAAAPAKKPSEMSREELQQYADDAEAKDPAAQQRKALSLEERFVRLSPDARDHLALISSTEAQGKKKEAAHPASNAYSHKFEQELVDAGMAVRNQVGPNYSNISVHPDLKGRLGATMDGRARLNPAPGPSGMPANAVQITGPGAVSPTAAPKAEPGGDRAITARKDLVDIGWKDNGDGDHEKSLKHPDHGGTQYSMKAERQGKWSVHDENGDEVGSGTADWKHANDLSGAKRAATKAVDEHLSKRGGSPPAGKPSHEEFADAHTAMNDARSGEDFSAQMKRLRESHAQHVEHAIAQGDAYKAPTFEGDEDQLNRLSMMHSRTQGLYNEAAYDAERKGPDAEMRTRQKRAQDLRKVMIEQEHALNVAKRKAEGRDDSIKAGRAAEEAGQGSLFKAVVDTILKAVGTQAGYWRTSPKGTQYFVPAHSRALPDRPAILQTADRNASRSTADLERKYGGRHKEQFIMQHPDTKENFLVRRFGSPAKSGYAIHDKTGKLAGTLHVSHKADHAHVTNGWTAPEHSGKQLHRPLLRALSGRHGAVLSPAAMSDDLHSSFSGMAKHGHRIGIHRSEKSGGARYLVAQDNPTLF